jgi:membrane associated rhomboid family serine protease
MSSTATAACYAVVLAAAIWSVGPPQHGRPRVPLLTTGALLVVGTVSTLQLTVFPALLGDLRRDRTALAHGQLWRLATSLVVQDGGWPGAAFNLVSLAVVGSVAESLWRRPHWLLIGLAAGVGAQFWGLVVQPTGAGNSVLVFGLAASLLVRAFHEGPPPSRVLAVVGLVAGATLLVTGDLHGGAVAIGGAVAAGLVGSQERARLPGS